jgi:hypothetical protein
MISPPIHCPLKDPVKISENPFKDVNPVRSNCIVSWDVEKPSLFYMGHS